MVINNVTALAKVAKTFDVRQFDDDRAAARRDLQAGPGGSFLIRSPSTASSINSWRSPRCWKP